MRNLIILGSGRSGTSMVAGGFRMAGYFMGRNLYLPSSSNPKGFFEDVEINSINENILAHVVPAPPRGPARRLFRSRPRHDQRWLARVRVGTSMIATSDIETRIRAQVEMRPFCFKDPRFCYTLPVWRPFLENTGMVCVFRKPGRTATSILRECRTEPYLQDLSMSMKRALQVWTLMYSHILAHADVGNWLFVHYNQVIDGTATSRLEAFSGAHFDATFADRELQRSSDDVDIPMATQDLYETLCNLAGNR